MLEINEALTGDDINTVKILFKEYAASLNFDLCFQNFDEELKNLPGEYSSPGGFLFLAVYNGHTAGCAALRKIDDEVCEMKRLYVRDEFRGLKIGKALAEKIILSARNAGYKKMRLDTVPFMLEAQSLYKSLGFFEIPSYRLNPVPDAIYMELVL